MLQQSATFVGDISAYTRQTYAMMKEEELKEEEEEEEEEEDGKTG